MLQMFATCPRGLESVLAEELAGLGAEGIAPTAGGVHFTGDVRITAKANLWSRMASRILVKLCTRAYRSEDDIYRAALSIDWPAHFSIHDSFRVHVTAVNSPVRSLEFITLRVKDAVCDRFRQNGGKRPNVNTSRPDQRVHAFLDRQTVTLYLDASGEALFKRGYRGDTGEAPLRENLAAGILRLTGWQPEQPLYDPMCGSGTFLIEAASMALNIAPGLNRRFAAERWKHVPIDIWAEERDAATALQRSAPNLRLYGGDIDGGALDIVDQQFYNNGWRDYVELARRDVRVGTAPAADGVWITNPPYGVRLSDTEQLARLYPAIGDRMKQQFAGWDCFFFSGDTQLPKLLGLRSQSRPALFNGALECHLYEYKIVSGTLRKPHEPDGTD